MSLSGYKVYQVYKVRKKQIKKLKKIFLIGILLLLITSTLFIVNKVNKTKQTTNTEAAPAGIIGGVDAKPSEFPYMALILKVYDNTIVRCGGTLIQKKFVLTAAHCLYYNKEHAEMSRFKIFFNKTNIEYLEQVTDTDKYYRAVEYYESNFDIKSILKKNDIAIIELDREVPKYFSKVTLVNKFETSFYKLENEVTFIGYGINKINKIPGIKTDLNDPSTYTSINENKLKKISLPISKPNLKIKGRMGFGFKDDRSLSNSPALGDSGSPILYHAKGHFGNKYYQIGVHSSGFSGTEISNSTATKIIDYLDTEFTGKVTGKIIKLINL